MTVEAAGPVFVRGRFAPSTTGRAHPGTLLAALLCWLDARHAGAEVWLRLEDLDRARTRPGTIDGLRGDLAWFGLDWDGETLQSESRALHAERLDALVREGRVYACDCTRATLRAQAERTPDGSFVYPGTCRAQRVTQASWRDDPRPLRLVLEADRVELRDESGVDLGGDPARSFGDPILRRRDGAFAYHFASVLDDAATGVDRVVRGRDLMPSTLLQVGLQRALGLSTPRYRHHLLLLERRGEKFSKLHGAVDAEALAAHYDGPTLCGALAAWAGLVEPGTRCRPDELVAGFDWSRVAEADVALAWDDERGLVRIDGDAVSPERVEANGGTPGEGSA